MIEISIFVIGIGDSSCREYKMGCLQLGFLSRQMKSFYLILQRIVPWFSLSKYDPLFSIHMSLITFMLFNIMSYFPFSMPWSLLVDIVLGLNCFCMIRDLFYKILQEYQVI